MRLFLTYLFFITMTCVQATENEDEFLPPFIEKEIHTLEPAHAVIMDIHPEPSGKLQYFILNSSEHIYEVLKKPLHWNRENWVTLAALVGVVAAGQHTLDNEMREFTMDESHRNKSFDDLAELGETLGNGLYVVPGMGVAYLLGEVTDNYRLKRVALIGLESRIATDILTTLMKVTTNRDRPNHDTKASDWHGLFGSKGPRSDAAFPSGHTATAFSFATVIALEYRDQPAIQILAYTAATMAGLSRIYDDDHWATDVIAGATIGYFTTKAIYSFYTDDTENDAPTIHVIPTMGVSSQGASAGLNLVVSF